jgi:hypothetical protein
MKAEQALYKVELSLKPAEQQADPDSITDEERFMFRKLGLRMKAFLLLGKSLYIPNLSKIFHVEYALIELYLRNVISSYR